MEELDIDIGMHLNMQLLVGEPTHRHEVQVIGYLKGESFLVTMPREGGALVNVCPHDEYIIRYLKGKNIVAFKTRVLHVASIPYYHLHLEFPQQFEKVKVRQSERINISVTAQTLVNGEKHWSVLRDISAGGALVVINDEIGKAEEHVELYFDLKVGEIERNIHLVAIIRNVRKGKNKDTGKDEYHYGVQFIDPSEQEMVFVQGFVYEQLVTHHENGSA